MNKYTLLDKCHPPPGRKSETGSIPRQRTARNPGGEGACWRVWGHGAGGVHTTRIPQKVFIELFRNIQFPHKSVNLSFTIPDINNKLMNLCGNQLLQNGFESTLCAIIPRTRRRLLEVLRVRHWRFSHHTLLSDTMYLSVGFGNSTPPPHCQLDVSISNSDH
jgi:hypothetical protein